MALLCHTIISLDRRKLNQIAEGIAAEEPWSIRDRLRWGNRRTRLCQPAPVILQVIDHQADVTLICSIRWMGIRKKMQFHLTLSSGEPDEIEMCQRLRRLFFLQPQNPSIERAHQLLSAGWNDHGRVL